MSSDSETDAPGPFGARRLDSAAVLRSLGLRDQIHPDDAWAFAYPDRESCEASAKRDREIYGNDVLGPYETEAGFVSVVDIRPQLLKQVGRVTDPSLPDRI